MGRRLADMAIGATVGGVVGAILAVNIVIYAGPDDGYEASLADVFDDSTVVGLVTLAALVAGPVVGIVVARRLRQ